MPAKDKYHDIVISALRKDGWSVVSEQVQLRLGEKKLWIDLRVSHGNQDIILIEVKSYDTASSPVEFLKQALGQYLLYRAILEEIHHPDPLYLAVPEPANTEIMQTELGQLIVEKYQLNVIIYDIEDEVIIKWINNS